jgi:DNA-binding protein YbaB
MAKGRKSGFSSARPARTGLVHDLQQQIARVQDLLAEETVTVTVGRGALRLVMTGDQKCQSVEVSEEFLQSAEADLLADLLKAGVNQALEASRDLAARRLGALAGGAAGH